MVDINLIGDDKGGEEKERVDEYSQPPDFDTQELATEDKTETFDTTKSLDYSFKGRSYTSKLSTFIIIGIIVLLGGAAYFFLKGNDRGSQEVITTLPEDAEGLVETIEGTESETEPPTSSTPEISELESEPESKSEPPIETSIPSTMSGNLDPMTSKIISDSKSAVSTVTSIMTTVPSNLSTTLLSYTGQRVRLEFVAPTKTDANEFTNRLTQNSAGGNFVVVSKAHVASDSRPFEKVLVSGSLSNNELTSFDGGVKSMNSEEAKAWFQQTARQYGLRVRDYKVFRASFVTGYEKIPIFVRIFGSKSSLIDFLNEFSAQNLNIELAKILFVSPDMVNFRDDNLVLVLNLYLYRAS